MKPHPALQSDFFPSDIQKSVLTISYIILSMIQTVYCLVIISLRAKKEQFSHKYIVVRSQSHPM